MYRLVVIDDEYIVVQGIKALLSRLKLDYEVVGAAYDGIQGLEVIRNEKPDVVITDIRIPGLDGLSVIETAKDECPDTNFIVISGYSEFAYAQRALTLGVKDYIDKPVTAEKLKNALARVESGKMIRKHRRTGKNSRSLIRSLKMGCAALQGEMPDHFGNIPDRLSPALRSSIRMSKTFGGNFTSIFVYLVMC